MKRLNGISPLEWPDLALNNTTEQIGKLMLDSCKGYEAYVAQLSTNETNRIINYQNIKGIPFHNSIFEIITHLMNHGTYHRGQLVTMLRGAGSTPIPATDLIVFYRENHQPLFPDI